MKKTILAVAALAVVTLSATSTSAQSNKAISVGISGGAAIPVGDFADFYTTGYNGTASLMFRSFGSPIGLRIDGMYNRLSVKDETSVSTAEGFPINAVAVMSANANLVYNLPGTGITPYLIGGAGVYGLRFDVEDADDPDVETKAGINAGIGASFPLSGFNTFIEARFHHIFTDAFEKQFIPVTFGISF